MITSLKTLKTVLLAALCSIAVAFSANSQNVTDTLVPEVIPVEEPEIIVDGPGFYKAPDLNKPQANKAKRKANREARQEKRKAKITETRAERKAKRQARRAERKANHQANKAKRKANRQARKAKRQARRAADDQ